MTEARAGVIHDIGYRHYDGPRLSRGYRWRSLLVHSLRGAFGLGRPARAKVLPFGLLALMCLPALVNIAIIAIGHNNTVLAYSGYAYRLQAAVALFAAAQAPVLASRDLRFHLVPLYFARPLNRGDYVLAKFAALAGALFALIAVPLTVLFLGVVLAGQPIAGQAPEYGRGLVAAALTALILAAIGLALAALTPRRGFGIASIIAVYAVSNAAVLVLQHVLLHRYGNATAASWLGIATPFDLVDGIVVWLFGVTPTGLTGPPGGAGGLVFLLAAVALVAGSVGFLLVRYRKAAIA